MMDMGDVKRLMVSRLNKNVLSHFFEKMSRMPRVIFILKLSLTPPPAGWTLLRVCVSCNAREHIF